MHKAGITFDSGGQGWNLFIKSYTFRSVLSDYTQSHVVQSPQSYEENTNRPPETQVRTELTANQCCSSGTEEVLRWLFKNVYVRKYDACRFFLFNLEIKQKWSSVICKETPIHLDLYGLIPGVKGRYTDLRLLHKVTTLESLTEGRHSSLSAC